MLLEIILDLLRFTVSSSAKSIHVQLVGSCLIFKSNISMSTYIGPCPIFNTNVYNTMYILLISPCPIFKPHLSMYILIGPCPNFKPRAIISMYVCWSLPHLQTQSIHVYVGWLLPHLPKTMSSITILSNFITILSNSITFHSNSITIQLFSLKKKTGCGQSALVSETRRCLPVSFHLGP